MSESTVTLYDTDFDAWAHEQAQHLRAKRITKLDYDHLAEEIEALAKRDWRALEHHLKNLILHCLKWEYQPQERARRGRRWQNSMNNARDAIEQILRDNHTYHDRLDAAMVWAYPRACRNAQQETGLPRATFPDPSDWTFEQFMDADLWR
jgi:Domain of unknown function DUF29